MREISEKSFLQSRTCPDLNWISGASENHLTTSFANYLTTFFA